MGWVYDFARIDKSQAVVYILFGCALVLPGMGYIYLFHNPVFENNEIFRVLFLSVFYSMPFILFGMLDYSSMPQELKKGKNEFISYISLFTLIYFLFLLSLYMFDILNTRTLVDRIFEGKVYYFMTSIVAIKAITKTVIYNVKSHLTHRKSTENFLEEKVVKKSS